MRLHYFNRFSILLKSLILPQKAIHFFNGGNVGIGTPTPSATLHVIGNLKTTSQIHASEFISVMKDGSYRVAMNGQGDGYIVGRNDLVENKFYIASKGNSFFNGGNVGIGTTTPDSKLTVAGNIHTQEIKVTVNAGADFVFDNEYKLRTLEETAEFVKKNRHLPEIASEKEMQENGLQLGEMKKSLN